MSKFVIAIFSDLVKAGEGAHLSVDRHAKDGEVLQGLAVIAKDNQRLSLKEIVHEHASGTAVGAFIGALAVSRLVVLLQQRSARRPEHCSASRPTS
jgi:hypothetical protein